MQLDLHCSKALAELAHESCWIPAEAAITRLGVAGDGNMNCVLRAHINNGTSVVFKQSLPYVAKYPQIVAPIERLDFEAAFYEYVASVEAVASRMPRVIGYDIESRVMCLQDLGEASDFSDIYRDDVSPADHKAEISGLLSWLAELHAMPMSVADHARFENPLMRQLNHQHIFVIPFQANNGLELDPVMVEFAEQLRSSPSVMQTIHELGAIYMGDRSHESRKCLLHGDFYPGSWLRDENFAVKVIDPEFCFAGPPEFDVGVLLAHLTFAGFDSLQIKELVGGYNSPDGFSWVMARQFAAVEVLRRLLGVAQLPVVAAPDRCLQWLDKSQTELEAR